MINLTIFENMYSNKTEDQLQLQGFDQFETLLYNLSKVPYKHKKQARLISPAAYEPNKTRANDNVVCWGGWAALDIDDHNFTAKDLKNELRDCYGDFHYICYSTASSTYELPKFRLVLKLSKTVDKDSIKKFWYALNTEFNSLGDRQTKDLSRMYYVPGTYDNAYNFIFTNTGNAVDVDMLIKKHPMPEKKKVSIYDHLPPAMQKMMIQRKKDALNNTSISWTTYEDCVFFTDTMINHWKSIAYIDNSGRYRDFYKLMCGVASRAVKKGYPINEIELIELMKSLDRDTSNRYQKRRLDVEAKNAIELAMAGV